MFKRKSVLYRYLTSFICTAMLSCIIVGLVGYMLASDELRLSAANEQKKRLMIAAEDLDAQFEHFQDISSRIMTSEYYQPYYFARNSYYEVELLDDLEKFSNYSSLVTYYFLHYAQTEYLYTRTGKTYLDAFAQERLEIENTEALQQMLNKCTSLTVCPAGTGLLAVYPVRLAAAYGYTGQATISFYLSRDVLLSRIKLVSSEKFTRMELYFDGECVLKTGEIISPVTVQHDRFKLVFDGDEITVEANERFLWLSMWAVSVFAFLLSAMAVYIAIRNYRPIAKLARRHNLEDGANEIEHLDKTLLDLEGKLRLSQEQTEKRMQIFKDLRYELQQHFVQNIMNGDADENALAKMNEIGLHFPSGRWSLFLLRFKLLMEEQAVAAVEELSDENAVFFASQFGDDNLLAVIVNADDCSSVADILGEVFPNAQLLGEKKTEMLSEIPTLLFEVLANSSTLCITPQEIAKLHTDDRLEALRQALIEKDEEKALRCLHTYCRCYEGEDVLLKKLMRTSINSVMLNVSCAANMSVPRSFLNGGDETYAMMELWISALCNAKDNVTIREEHKIIRYLREHALDYNLTMENVADYFRCSTRQITRTIQKETGDGYRAFISKMRLEHAKEMLRSGKTVNDTYEAVCYSSRSHFIKSFTEYTGFTPSKYRSRFTAEEKGKNTQQL